MRHGEWFYYQQLLLLTPFRDSSPAALVSSNNETGTQREQCELDGLVKQSEDWLSYHYRKVDGAIISKGPAAMMEREAIKFLFSKDHIKSLLDAMKEHAAVDDSLSPDEKLVLNSISEEAMDAETHLKLHHEVTSHLDFWP